MPPLRVPNLPLSRGCGRQATLCRQVTALNNNCGVVSGEFSRLTVEDCCLKRSMDQTNWVAAAHESPSTHRGILRTVHYRGAMGIQNPTMYSFSMPKLSSLILVIFCTSLLCMQLSGMHLHVNPDGDGGLHGTHVHDADHDGHGHETDTDVSLLELLSGWIKLLLFLAPFVFIVLAIMRPGKLVWAPITHILYPRDRSRWRPPLRAPPIPIS